MLPGPARPGPAEADRVLGQTVKTRVEHDDHTTIRTWKHGTQLPVA